MVEHFDEYMDEAVVKVQKGEYTALLRNVALEDFEQFGTNTLPLKIYSVKTRKFYHFRSFVDLSALHKEAQSILRHLDPDNTRAGLTNIGVGL